MVKVDKFDTVMLTGREKAELRKEFIEANTKIKKVPLSLRKPAIKQP